MNSSLVWYTARASGIVAYLLLATGAIWGLAVSTKAARTTTRRAWVLDLHRFLGAGAVVFLVVHVTAIMLDTYVHFTIADVLVPFATSWHPAAVAWGITAGYLLVAVELTSLLRTALPARAWRATHYVSFPLFALSTVHGLTAGTDRNDWIAQAMYFGASAAVAVLSVRRVTIELRARRRRVGPVPLPR